MNTYFQRREFKCKCGLCSCDTVDAELLAILTRAREHFNSPVTINSGHRCPAYNESVGGSSNSQHLTGRAADIVVSGVPPVEVQQYFESLYPTQYGLGSYSSFTHIDTRGYRARW